MSSLRSSYGKIANTTRVPLAQPMSLNGVVGGSTSMAVDGSTTPVIFYYQPTANEMATIFDYSIVIGDAGNTGENDYGSIIGPLLNGVQFFAVIDGVEFDFGTPVIRAAQYFARGARVNFIELSGNKRIANYQFSFFDTSDGTRLNGQNGDRLGVKIQDNLSTLSAHTVSISGFMRNIVGS